MTMSFGKAALLLGAASLLAPFAAASAQEVRDLDRERSDVLIYEGAVTTTPVVYRYTIPAQTTLRVDVIPAEGSELDPVVTITDRRSGEVLAEDDDGGEGLASRARVFSEAGQQIEISVSSFAFFSGEESTGAFELQLRPTAYRPPVSRPIAFGGQAQGSLTSGEPDYYTITGQKGQMLQVALTAEDEELDPLLSLYRGADVQADPLTSDDDGGGGLNSLLRFVLPADGTYTIAAGGYNDSLGSYTLRVAEASSHPDQASEQVLGLGERSSGFVGGAYDETTGDPASVSYALSPEAIAAIRAGDGKVTFNMTTPIIDDEYFPSGVDAYLELGFDTPLGFASMMSDDDGGDGLNSRIAVDLTPLAQQEGWLERLRVHASSIGAGGAFEIEMVEGLQEVATYEDYAEEATDAVAAAADAVEEGD